MTVRDLQGLGKDRWIRLAAATTTVFVVSWMVAGGRLGEPPASWETLADAARRWSGVLLLVTAFCSLHFGISMLPSIAERFFWTDLRNASIPWLAVTVLYAFYDGAHPGWLKTLDQFLYILYYVGFYLAIERRPHSMHRWRPLGVERRLSLPTVGLAVSGLSVYFFFVSQWTGEPPASAVPLFLLFDGYFSVRLALLWRAAQEARWKWIYGFLAFSVWILFLNDLLLTASILGASLPLWGAVAELSWKAPSIFLILAARARHLRIRHRSDAAALEAPEENLPGPLGQTLFFALLFPVVHHSGYARWALSESHRDLRETVMIVWVMLLTALALYQYRVLEQTTAQLRAEREEAERALRQVEKNLQLRSHRQQIIRGLDRARRRFAVAFEICPDGLALSRLRDGRFFEVNSVWMKLFGFEDKADVLGKTSLELGVWGRSEQREAVIEKLKEDGFVLDFEAFYQRRDGSRGDGFFSASLIEIDGEQCLLSISRFAHRPPEDVAASAAEEAT